MGATEAIAGLQILQCLRRHRVTDERQGFGGRGSRPDGMRACLAEPSLSRALIRREPRLARGGRRHRADNGAAILDQANIDREVGIIAHEGLGAIQRVHKEKTGADRIGGSKFTGVLLRDHRNIAEALRQPRQNQSLRTLVRHRDGALVGLGGYREA